MIRAWLIRLLDGYTPKEYFDIEERADLYAKENSKLKAKLSEEIKKSEELEKQIETLLGVKK